MEVLLNVSSLGKQRMQIISAVHTSVQSLYETIAISKLITSARERVSE